MATWPSAPTASACAFASPRVAPGAVAIASNGCRNGTGQLVNPQPSGTFALPQKLQATASSMGGTAAAGGAIGGATAPTALLTYNKPVSNDSVTLTFKQPIGATDALRTGTYSKTLTFTLSTTNP